jgi:hypothetical protein
MRGVASSALRALAALALAGVSAAAAQSDAPRAPRIIPAPGPATGPSAVAAPAPAAAAPLGALRPPSPARLAPLPEERGDAIDEIVVVGEGWRLPDLGSDWRAKQEAQARQERLNAVWFPLYDPARPPLRPERWLATGEERRHGYIDIFRLRFGRRSRDAPEEP